MKLTLAFLVCIALSVNFSYSHDTLVSKKGKGKVVGLDNYYNNEWKKTKDGKTVPWHYLWDDPDDSGLKDLKGIISNTGAKTATLQKAPTLSDLNKFSIYIIIDPDTPKESEKPNYIQDDAINAIVEWVKKGGVLVLFGNDAGNAEFEHWNKLAEKFGIYFEETSENRVIGTNWDMGKYDNLPAQPLFKNIKKIYLKEVSTLKLQSPAEPLLINDKSIIMATAKVGKGFVFAVGDPWMYDEYTGHSRLPQDFQNYETAINLFDWLLPKAQKVKK